MADGTAPEGGEAPRTTVLLVDDNALFRRGLSLLIERSGTLTVVGQATNGLDAVRLARELRPDVVVMDTEMPVLDGIQATARITAAPQAPAVVVLAAARSTAAIDAILAGACGMLLKDAEPREIIAGITLAAAGLTALAPAVAGELVVRMRELEQARRAQLPRCHEAALTAREQDVLVLLTAGRDNLGIGRELYISPSTVKHHVTSILSKLEVHNRVQAAVEAVRIGLA